MKNFLKWVRRAFKKDCLKSFNIDNECAEDILDNMSKDLSKDVCENRINKFKNLTETGTKTLVENQTSTSAGQVTYDTYNDNTDGFSLEYPSDWHISDGSKGLNVYKGTREFTVTIYDDPQISLIDTYDFGRIQFNIYNDDNKYEITDELGEINIDDEPALSFSYSYGSMEVMATALIHNNLGYLFKYETMKENSEDVNEIDTMTRFLATIRFSPTAPNTSNGEMPSQPSSQNSNSNPQALYDECVRVAGKPYCDFLFKK